MELPIGSFLTRSLPVFDGYFTHKFAKLTLSNETLLLSLLSSSLFVVVFYPLPLLDPQEDAQRYYSEAENSEESGYSHHERSRKRSFSHGHSRPPLTDNQFNSSRSSSSKHKMPPRKTPFHSQEDRCQPGQGTSGRGREEVSKAPKIGARGQEISP